MQFHKLYWFIQSRNECVQKFTELLVVLFIVVHRIEIEC